MAIMFMPSAVVEPPPATPPPHGLRDSAREIADTESRWEGGVEFCPETCAEILAWSSFCAAPVAFADAPANVDCVQAAAYTLYVPFDCVAVGEPSRDDRGRVTRQLEAGTSKGMERQFWGDPLGTDGYALVNSVPNVQGDMWDGTSGIVNNDAVAGPVPLSPKQGLARLAQALASCGLGSRGMIHGPVLVAEMWAEESLAVDGPRLVTKARGDVVVAGSGYPGTGPVDNVAAAPANGLVWAYATGMVEYRLGEIRFEGDATTVLDRKQNNVTWYGQRSALTVVDGCCQFGVLIDTELA